MSLEVFMQELLAASPINICQSRVQIVSDNAKLTCNILLAIQRPPSLGPRIHRHHSEPIVAEERSFGFHPKAVTRWEASSAKSDQVLNAPRRAHDRRWSVARNHSDSSLLLPTRKTDTPVAAAVADSVLSSLRRKHSASKVISEMSQSARKQLFSEIQSFLEDSEGDMGPEPLIEQLLRAPTIENRLREGNDRFLRSILEDNELEEPSSGSAKRSLFGFIQAIVGFLLIVAQILSKEVLGPMVWKPATQLLQTILAAAPMNEVQECLLPLFTNEPTNYGSTITTPGPPITSSPHQGTGKAMLPQIIRRQESWDRVHRNEVVVL